MYLCNIKNNPIKRSVTQTKLMMKTLNLETSFDLFKGFVLSNEEMINVRGGEGDPAGDKGLVCPPATADPEI